MNKRQKALYEFLLKRGGEYTTQADVAYALPEYYGNGECYFAQGDFHNTAERFHLSRDIREINLSPDFDKIIISNANGIKIADEAEFDRYIDSQFNSALRRLARISRIAKKGGRHKQIDLNGHTFESFLEGYDK